MMITKIQPVYPAYNNTNKKQEGINYKMAKRLIIFYDEAKANEVATSLNIKYMEDIMTVNGKEKSVYMFVEDENLSRLLQNKAKYSKRDYCYSSIMKF